MADRSEVSDLLYHLINTCRDGESGYREAAKIIVDASSRSFCNEQSQQRGRFAGELEEEMRQLSEPDWHLGKGSVVAHLHRAWFELKDKLVGGDRAILDSVELGEDKARQNYEQALANQNLPLSMRNLLKQQAQQIIAAYDEVRILRDRMLNV